MLFKKRVVDNAATCNLGQKFVDKLTELSKIDFSLECFTADFLRDFAKIVKIWLLVGWLNICHQIQVF